MRLTSQAIITSRFRNTIESLVALRSDERIVVISTPQLLEEDTGLTEYFPFCKGDTCRITITEKKNFSIDDAKLAIEKAYMSSEVETIIILAAKEFSIDVQNKLLKVIEEPPPGVSFILMVSSKAALLPTVRSRLPVAVLREKQESKAFELDMAHLDLVSVYDFVQKHKRLIDKTAAKSLVERISTEAIKSQRFDLDEKTLQLFYNAFKALDVGSPPQFVFTTLLLKLLARRKR
ncbi:MAG: DNA polymerase III subunit delta' [Campylobacterota bacterium]|nr:DNA polymerase III subunit delta' [Campylobacterota bacterium]